MYCRINFILHVCLRFRKIANKTFELDSLANKYAGGSHLMLNRVARKSHLGICAILEAKTFAWNRDGKLT